MATVSLTSVPNITELLERATARVASCKQAVYEAEKEDFKCYTALGNSRFAVNAEALDEAQHHLLKLRKLAELLRNLDSLTSPEIARAVADAMEVTSKARRAKELYQDLLMSVSSLSNSSQVIQSEQDALIPVAELTQLSEIPTNYQEATRDKEQQAEAERKASDEFWRQVFERPSWLRSNSEACLTETHTKSVDIPRRIAQQSRGIQPKWSTTDELQGQKTRKDKQGIQDNVTAFWTTWAEMQQLPTSSAPSFSFDRELELLE